MCRYARPRDVSGNKRPLKDAGVSQIILEPVGPQDFDGCSGIRSLSSFIAGPDRRQAVILDHSIQWSVPDLQHLLVFLRFPRRLLLAQSSEPRLIRVLRSGAIARSFCCCPPEPEPSLPTFGPLGKRLHEEAFGRAHARQTSSLILWPARFKR